jgi:hypothetical protein
LDLSDPAKPFIAKAEEVRVKAIKAGRFSEAIACVPEIGVLTGLRIERSERRAPNSDRSCNSDSLSTGS